MIDTIKLLLDRTMFWITDISLFQKEKQNACRGYFTLVQNPTKSELLKGIYKPRLTLTKRFNCSKRFEETLSVELSLSKLLFNNNFDELALEDFDQINHLLKSKLKDMGVMIWEKVLPNVPVSAIHYSKNIPLTDGTTPHYLISRIKEANIKLSLDVNQTDYRNDGQNYKWRCNSYEISFYDKLKELEKSAKNINQALRNDDLIQLNLFKQLEKKRLEILRMEARLNKRQKIKQLFRILNIQSDFTFKSLFDPAISKKVLLHFLDELESQRLILLDYKPTTAKTFLSDLIIKNPKIGLLRTLQIYGLKQAFNMVTPRELRIMFGNYSQRSWYRLIAESKKINLPVTISPFKIIRKHLIDFKPLKLVDFY